MLDDYKISQPIAFKIISNQIKKNLLSHAYIIETNSNIDGLVFAKAFAKSLLCPNKYFNSDKCDGCKQCENIDTNNFIELKIIEPEGNWITKNQIDDLQQTFIKKAIVGNIKVYIINHAEKMKQNIMDSLLKFIEEPLEGIIAILVTDNINNIMDTIISRCQIITLKRTSNKLTNSTLDNIPLVLDFRKYVGINYDQKLLDNVLNLINYYEINGINTILYLKQMWHDNFKDSVNVEFALNIMTLFYKEALDYKINKSVRIFKSNEKNIETVSNKNDLDVLAHKINVIMKALNKIKYNANLSLLMDKLIIELEKRN